MTDDDDEHLLRDLGRYLRAQRRDPDGLRFERLAQEALSREEQAALEADAATDPELAVRVKAHLPLSPAVRAQIAARVLATVRANPPQADDSAASAGADALGSDAVANGPVLLRAAGAAGELRAPRARGSARAVRALWLAAPLSAAAGFFLWMASVRSPSESLPSYSLEVTGAQAELRGPAARTDAAHAPIRVGPSTELTLVLRPASEVRGEVSAAVFLAPLTGEPVPWPAQVVKASSGALRVVLAPPPKPIVARTQARIVVADAKLLHEEGALLVRAERAQARNMQHLVLELIPAVSP